ncbi:MAG: ferrous iron transport protein B [Treponema sp.]
MKKSQEIRIAFAGQPNSGKSTLFNLMTGSHQHVANYPGITVEKKTGEYVFNGSDVYITDLPGTYSLTSYSPEERVSREFILKDNPDLIVNITDGSNLERQLYLTFQLLEMERPMVMYVNKLDAAQALGLTVDHAELSRRLGIPIVAGSAKKRQQAAALKELIQKEAENPSGKGLCITYGTAMEDSLKKITALLEEGKKDTAPYAIPLRWIAVKLCEHDETVTQELPLFFSNAEAVKTYVAKAEAAHKETYKHSFEIEIAMARAKAARSLVSACVTKNTVDKKTQQTVEQKSRAAAFAGCGILFTVTYFILHAVFKSAADSFLKPLLAYPVLVSVLSVLFAGVFTAGAIVIYRRGSAVSINSADRVDKVLCHRVYGPLILVELILVFYWITVVLGYMMTDKVFPFFRFVRALVSQALPPLAFVTEGVLRGLFLSGVIDGAIMILNYVPIFLCLFALVAFLEDVGYMARLAFIMDRILRKFGLHGQSTLPMILSGVIMGGCVVPGVMSTRTIRDDKSRLVTLLILPLLNCMAKIPFYVLITGIFFQQNQWLVLGGVSFFTLFAALIIAKFFSLYVVPGEAEPFVLELPAYNLPTLSGIAIRTWERLWSFIKKVATTVVAVAVVIWAGITFPSLGSNAQNQYAALKADKIEQFARTVNNSYVPYIGQEKQLIDYFQFEEKYSIASTLNWFGGESEQSKIATRFFLENPEYAKIMLKGQVELGAAMPLFESYYAAYKNDFAAFSANYEAADETQRHALKTAFYTKWMQANPYFFALVRTGSVSIKGTAVIDNEAKAVSKQLRNLSADIKTIGRNYRKETLEHSVLGMLGKLFEPVSQFAGFDWRINVAILGAFAAKEALVSTLGTIYSVEAGSGTDGTELQARIQNNETGMTPLDGLVIMILIALFPPCIATMMAIKTETQSWKWALFSIVYPVFLGGIVSTFVYQVGRLLGY